MLVARATTDKMVSIINVPWELSNQVSLPLDLFLFLQDEVGRILNKQSYGKSGVV